tara:strand:- start:1132 stop:1245 length:114 start_codon:yes stop_codon:yes gene_type:complete
VEAKPPSAALRHSDSEPVALMNAALDVAYRAVEEQTA